MKNFVKSNLWFGYCDQEENIWHIFYGDPGADDFSNEIKIHYFQKLVAIIHGRPPRKELRAKIHSFFQYYLSH